jgi:Lon protease-like protein
MSQTLPMFPLGTVLFPSMVMPLHIFEPRYRALARAVTEGDRRFGVVLIERGSEVGGGDVRTDIGTVANVVEAREMPDGRWALGCVGGERLRVESWLDDDPYPRAVVEVVRDAPLIGDEADDWPSTVRHLRRALALQAELGEARAPVDVELSVDPVAASFQAGAIGPFGPLDQQRILAESDPGARIQLVGELLAEGIPLLEARLAAP